MENNTIIDLNSLPESNWDPKELIAMMKQQKTMPIYTTDTNTYVGGITPSSSIWGQTENPYRPLKSTWDLIEEIKLENKILGIRLLVLEGVFTKEEGDNIKAMLTSNDEASVTLAETILENAEQ